MIVDIYHIPDGRLWDAYHIAHYLGFPQQRLRFHKHEYLFHRHIEAERILAVLPAGGGHSTIPIHLGEITLPRATLQHVGSSNPDAIKDWLLKEVYSLCGVWDEIKLQQVTDALCIESWSECA